MGRGSLLAVFPLETLGLERRFAISQTLWGSSAELMGKNMVYWEFRRAFFEA